MNRQRTSPGLDHRVVELLIRALEDQEASAGLSLDAPVTGATRLVRDLDFDLVRLAALTRRLTGELGPTIGPVIGDVCTARGRVVDVEVAILAQALGAAIRR